MPYKMQFRRGAKADLPELDNGEPGFTEDTEELFVGTPNGNKQLTFPFEARQTLEQHTQDIEQVSSQLAQTAINVQSYKHLVENGDWTEAVREASRKLKELGGGKLIFPPANVYNLFSMSKYPDYSAMSNEDKLICDFGNISVEIDFMGSVVNVDRTDVPVEKTWTYFKFKDANNVSLHDLNHYSIDAKTNGGAVVMFLEGKCSNVNVWNIKGEGIARLIEGQGDPINFTMGTMTNINSWNIELDNCYKPFTFRWGVKNIRIWNYVAKNIHRAFHGYMVEDVEIDFEAEGFNTGACLFTSYFESGNNIGVRRAKINAKTSGSADYNTIPFVALSYVGNGGNTDKFGVFEDIDLNVDIGNKPGFIAGCRVAAFSDDNPITSEISSRGHVLRNFKMSGNLNSIDKRFFDIHETFKSGNVLENITFKNVEVPVKSIDTVIDCSALKGSMTVRNVKSSSTVFGFKNVPSNRVVNVFDSYILGISADASPMEIVNSKLVNSGYNKTNKILINTYLDDMYFQSMKKNIGNLTYPWYTTRPEVLGFVEKLGNGLVSSGVLDVELPGLGADMASRTHLPQLFKIQIGYSDNATNHGFILGQIKLRRSSVSGLVTDDTELYNMTQIRTLGNAIVSASATATNGVITLTIDSDLPILDRMSAVITL